ncbi:MAG: hypothetical protein ACFCUQ_09010 [Kiloniellales bacterium]
MADIAKQVEQRKRAHAGEQQRLEALRKRKTAAGKRLAPYVELERSELRRDAKLTEAGKRGDGG